MINAYICMRILLWGKNVPDYRKL